MFRGDQVWPIFGTVLLVSRTNRRSCEEIAVQVPKLTASRRTDSDSLLHFFFVRACPECHRKKRKTNAANKTKQLHRPQLLLRHPRARHGVDPQRYHVLRPPPLLRLHLPGVRRLHARAHACGRSLRTARELHPHPRLHRCRRGEESTHKGERVYKASFGPCRVCPLQDIPLFFRCCLSISVSKLLSLHAAACSSSTRFHILLYTLVRFVHSHIKVSHAAVFSRILVNQSS